MKAVTWRILGVLVLGVVTWFLTQSWETTTMITVFFHATQVVLYYFHERLWDRADWGLKKREELTEKEKEKVMERLRKLGYLD
jgi:uncharacterized membrane protein